MQRLAETLSALVANNFKIALRCINVLACLSSYTVNQNRTGYIYSSVIYLQIATIGTVQNATV